MASPDPDGTEYATAAGRDGPNALVSLARFLAVPVAEVRAVWGDAARVVGLIESRATAACPGCGGALRWPGQLCYCLAQQHARQRPDSRLTLSGLEAVAQLRRRLAPPA